MNTIENTIYLEFVITRTMELTTKGMTTAKNYLTNLMTLTYFTNH